MTATHTPVRPVVDRDRQRACRVAHAFGAVIAGAVVLLLLAASQFHTRSVSFPVLLAAGSVAALTGLAADLIARPARVSLDGGWLTTARLGRRDRVHTESLTGLAPNPHAAGSIVLTDQAGNRAEIDVRCLVRNPLLWQHLYNGVTRARHSGALELSEPESLFWQTVIREAADADQRALSALDFEPSR